MGMFRCPDHGLTFFLLACEHVSDAIDDARRMSAQLALDRGGSGVLLCDVCFPKPVRRFAGMNLDSLSVVPVCDDHAAAWYYASGKGQLLEALEQLKKLL